MRDSSAGPETGSLGGRPSAGPNADPDHRYLGVELRDLRYFVGVAEELHFGRAAARLYISQPGLSQAMARLERELEVELLARGSRSVELTEAGAELLDRARRLLGDLDDALTRVRSIGRGELGALRVGVALLAEATVAPALNAFGAEHPGIVLERSFMLSERLLEQLQEARLHAVIVHQLPALASAGVEWEPLRRGPLAVLVSRRHELAGRAIVTLGELRDQTFLVNPPSLAPGAFAGLKLMCREFGGFDAKVLESTAASTAPLDADWEPIEDGAAIAVVSEPAARMVRRAEIAVVLLQPPPLYAVAVAWRRRERGAPVDRLLDHLRGYRDRHAWTGGVGDGPADATVRSPSIYALNGRGSHDTGREQGAVLL